MCVVLNGSTMLTKPFCSLPELNPKREPFTNWRLSISVSCGTVDYAVLGGCLKALEQCFPVVLFIMLHKVVLTFESVDEILKCDHSNESY